MANPGHEYLVLQPDETRRAFALKLPAGDFSVEWHSVTSRETVGAETVSVASEATTSFTAPFEPAGPAMLYLTRARASCGRVPSA